jgi:hypothetical protein
MPEKLKAAQHRIWALPCKSIIFLLIVCLSWEGDLKMLTKTDPLPAAYLVLLGIAALLLLFDRGFPIKVCVALVITNMAIRDNYPFSHFPMYASFSDHTYYVYVADKDDQPVPLQELTGIRTSKLKKPYDKDLDKARKKLDKRKRELSAAERSEAGATALRQAYRNAGAEGMAKLEALAPLKLYHVDIYMRDGEVNECPAEFIAEIELPLK